VLNQRVPIEPSAARVFVCVCVCVCVCFKSSYISSLNMHRTWLPAWPELVSHSTTLFLTDLPSSPYLVGLAQLPAVCN